MRTLLFRLLHSFVTRFASAVIVVSTLSAIGFSLYGLFYMEFITDQDKLLSEDLPYHHRYMEFIRRFGDLEFLYVLVEGSSQEQMIAYADTLAERLSRSHDVKEIIYRVETSWASKYALLYAPVEDLLEMKNGLAANREEIQQLYSIRSVDDILQKISDSLDPSAKPAPGGDDGNEAELKALLAALNGTYAPAQSEFGELKALLEAKEPAYEYFWSASKHALLMMVMPAKDYTTLSVIERPLQRIRSDIRLTSLDFPGITAGLTGRPALQADEMTTTNRDVMNSSFLAFAAVALLFFGYFRELTRPALAILVLLFSMGWTYGFVALTLGHLNLLSTVFCLVLIGLGIDFGIHFIARYQDELNKGADPSAAIMETLQHVGSGTVTGAMTSSVAFLSAMTTDFIGLAELGYVAGMGIIFCLLGMLITLPALLLVYDTQFRRHQGPIEQPLHMAGLRHVSRHPRLLLLGILILTMALIEPMKNLEFNDNLLELQAEGVESVEYEHKLLDESEFSSWYCSFVAPTLDEARTVSERLKREPLVAKVDSLTEILPPPSKEKAALREEIRTILEPVIWHEETQYLPDPVLHQNLARQLEMMFLFLNPETQVKVQKQIDRMQKMEAMKERQKLGHSKKAVPTTTPAQDALDLSAMPSAETLASLRQLQYLLTGPRTAVEARLKTANRLLLEEPREELEMLAQLAAVDEVDQSHLPDVFQTLYIGNDGTYLVMAFPKHNIWEHENMSDFVAAMRAIDPHVTGTPIQVYESSRLMRDSFRDIALLSLIAVTVLVFLDFWSLGSTIVVMTPLLMGVLWLLQFMGVTGIQLNLANFFAIPILVGIGVDSAVHFYHRYKETQDVEESVYTTGTTLTVTALTTLLGFGPLVNASHRGLASLGLLMTVGTITCWFACVIFFPTLIKAIRGK